MNKYSFLALPVSCLFLLGSVHANAQTQPGVENADGAVSAVESFPQDAVPRGPDTATPETFTPPDASAASFEAAPTPADTTSPAAPTFTATDEPQPVVAGTAAPGTAPTISNEPPVTASAPSVSPNTMMPSPDGLSQSGAVSGQPAMPLSPLPQAAEGASAGNAMGATDAPVRHSGTYYDSNARVPNAALSSAGITGPRKIDPALEPGQTFVTITDSKSATSFEGQYVAATRALKLGRYPAAMEMFSKLNKKSPKDTRILMGLALAQQGSGSKESAIRTYEDILRIQPNNASAIINLMGLTQSNDPKRVVERLTELRNKYPDNAGVPAQIGLVNASMQNYGEAIKYMEIAASMEPNNPSHIYNMAIVTDKEGDAKKAVSLYEQALQMDASLGNTVEALPRDVIYDRLVVLRRKI